MAAIVIVTVKRFVVVTYLEISIVAEKMGHDIQDNWPCLLWFLDRAIGHHNCRIHTLNKQCSLHTA